MRSCTSHDFGLQRGQHPAAAERQCIRRLGHGPEGNGRRILRIRTHWPSDLRGFVRMASQLIPGLPLSVDWNTDIPPAIAVKATSTTKSHGVYMSWNGATKVVKWRVLGATGEGGPYTKVSPRVSPSGLETKIPVSSQDTWFEVQALGASGASLADGTSQRAAPETP